MVHVVSHLKHKDSLMNASNYICESPKSVLRVLSCVAMSLLFVCYSKVQAQHVNGFAPQSQIVLGPGQYHLR
jgi:hypothetical protein